MSYVVFERDSEWNGKDSRDEPDARIRLRVVPVEDKPGARRAVEAELDDAGKPKDFVRAFYMPGSYMDIPLWEDTGVDGRNLGPGASTIYNTFQWEPGWEKEEVTEKVKIDTAD